MSKFAKIFLKKADYKRKMKSLEAGSKESTTIFAWLQFGYVSNQQKSQNSASA